MILDRLQMTPGEFSAGTRWAITPEGACRADLCVPLPPGAVHEGLLAVEATAERLGMPLLHDDEAGLWALGPASVTGRVLTSAEAPPLTLPGVDGNPFSLSSLRGQKVLLVAWASW